MAAFLCAIDPGIPSISALAGCRGHRLSSLECHSDPRAGCSIHARLHRAWVGYRFRKQTTEGAGAFRPLNDAIPEMGLQPRALHFQAGCRSLGTKCNHDSRIPGKTRVSSPLNRRIPRKPHIRKEKKISAKWHLSFVQPAIIKLGIEKEKAPVSCRGFFLFNAPSFWAQARVL